MKTALFSLLLFCATGLSAFAQDQSFLIDPKGSQLTWTGFSEVGSYAPTGSIQLKSGHLTKTDNQLLSGTFVFDMTTIQHENGQMQGHLRGEDFFDTGRFPTATFTLQKLTGSTATGQLTIRGITRPISFAVSVTPDGQDLRLKGKAVVDRTQFNIRYNSTSFFASLGDQAIKNEFSLAFDLTAKQSPVGKQHHSR